MTSPDTDKSARCGIPKSEILRGHEAFGTVFSGSKYLQARYIRCYYRVDTQIPPYTCTVGFAVRKAGNAVRRNRARRLLRECWRTKKHRLLTICRERQLHLRCVLIIDMQRVHGLLPFRDVDVQLQHIIPELENIVVQA